MPGIAQLLAHDLQEYGGAAPWPSSRRGGEVPAPGLMAGVEVDEPAVIVFLPGDPPRRGRLAFVGQTCPLPGSRAGRVPLAVRRGRAVRRVEAPARLLDLPTALAWLASLPADGTDWPALSAWALAVKAGLAVLGRGRLVPTVTEGGWDGWRAGPLDAREEGWLRQLGAAFPPEAHCLAAPGTGALRVWRAEELVRSCWDAIADVLPRTAAAPLAAVGAPFAGRRAVGVGGWREWLQEADSGLREAARPGIRLELPQEAGGRFLAVLQLRSHADPSLVVEASELWRAPAPVLRRFGEAAETDLLVALRRGARVWPPLGRALAAAHPDQVELEDQEVELLLGLAGEQLAGAGLEVLWPAELGGELRARARATPPPPGSGVEAGFSLDSLLDFRWQLTLDGEPLTEAEMDAVAEAKRPVVRLRDRWLVLDPELVRQLRSRPPRITAAEALAAELGGGTVEIGGRPVEVVLEGAVAELAQRIRTAATPSEVPEPRGLEGQLRPYQRRGLAWLSAMAETGLGGCLADDMGLGKTIQMIALHLRLGPGPTLVVCPASLLGNWERELHRFAPSVPTRRYHGGSRSLEELAAQEVVLATYGVMRRDRAQLAEVGWKLVVADEAQHVKNPDSRGARELRAIPAGIRFALTGTPIENRLSELWSILDWTTPGLLGPLERFQRRLATPIERYGDEAARERLTRVVRPFLLRRRKVDPEIAPELPRKTETDLLLSLTEEQATLYEAVVREIMDQIRESSGMNRRGLVFKLLTALKQICNHPAHYLRQEGPLFGRSGKLAAVEELLEIIVSEGDSCLVFTQFVEMGKLLERHLRSLGIETAFLHGKVEPRRRDQMVSLFQEGRVPVFLLSLKAGGVGLNLTRATHVIHYDRWWNPAVEDQATDRAYRIGQDRPVQVHRLVAQGTLEDKIALLLERKRELADSIVGSGEAWISELGDSELAELVSLQRSA